MILECLGGKKKHLDIFEGATLLRASRLRRDDGKRVARKNRRIEGLTLKIQTLKLVYETGQYFAGKNPFKFTD